MGIIGIWGWDFCAGAAVSAKKSNLEIFGSTLVAEHWAPSGPNEQRDLNLMEIYRLIRVRPPR